MDIDPQSVKSGFDAIKAAFETLRSLRDMFKSDPLKYADADETILRAEREVKFAEAQLAQALGYHLCRAHFPPVPMLKDRVEPISVKTIYKCPECQAEIPSPEHFLKKARQNASLQTHYARTWRV